MKETTKKLLAQIEESHDWANGQVYGRGGTSLTSTDTCRVCSLRRHWLDDTQNGIHDSYRFSDGETNADLSLRQAVVRGCAAPPKQRGIERGHFTIARSLLRKLAAEYPDQILMFGGGKDLRGMDAIAYLDGLPDSRAYISDCPKPAVDGACGCFA